MLGVMENDNHHSECLTTRIHESMLAVSLTKRLRSSRTKPSVSSQGRTDAVDGPRRRLSPQDDQKLIARAEKTRFKSCSLSW